MKKRYYIRAIWLFLRIVWRDWHGERISPSCAWDVAKGIWLED